MFSRRHWYAARADSRNIIHNLGGPRGGGRPKQISLQEWSNLATSGKVPNLVTSASNPAQHVRNTPKHKDRSDEYNLEKLSTGKDAKAHRFCASPYASGSFIGGERQVFHGNMGVTQIW